MKKIGGRAARIASSIEAPAATRDASRCSRCRWRSNARITATGNSPSWKTRARARSSADGVALGRREQRVVERQRGAVGDHGARVVELDPAAIAGIKRQFFEFGAGQQPVAAEMSDQEIDRVAADRDVVRRAGLPDHRGEIARTVGIAADRDGIGRIVEDAAQRRAAGQIAGLDDDQRVARHIREKPPAERGQRIAGLAHPDDAASAHQADLRRLVGEPRRIGGERGGGQLGDAERVAQIGADGARDRVGALAHEPGIGAVEQDGADFGIGPPQERGDPRRRQLHGGAALSGIA